MSFITEIVAVQARYKQRVQEINAEHEAFVEAIEKRFLREQVDAEGIEFAQQWLEISVLSRQDLLCIAEEWRAAKTRTAVQERDEEFVQFISATASAG